jgi:putative CocE/NonD family hydrolase
MLLINQHPAVRAIAPRFALFDVYTDIAMPGGVHLTWFTETWGRANRALDSNELEVIAGPWLSRLVVGASEVDGDGSRSQLEANANSHRWNYDVHRGAQEIVFRDDPARSQGGFTTDTFSPHAHIEATRAAGAAVYSYSGWLDGAYPNAAIKRHRSLARPGDRLLLGPWNHGGDQSIEPRRVSRKRAFDHAGELLRFFDRHVRDGNPLPDDELPVTYYTMVEGRWKHAASWPPPSAPLRLYLAPDQALVEVRPGRDGFDAYQVDPTAGTGDAARWNSLMGDNGPIEYPRRAERDARLLVYDTAPLEQAVEVTGHGLVQLYVRLHAPDANVFAYLEDVAPDASVTYVTEGQLRALHRKRRPVEEASYATPLPWWRSFERADAQPVDPDAVTELVFELLPTSYLFEPGHRIRLAIAGADIDHFPAFPGASPTWEVQRGERWPSHVELPVIRR